MRCASLESWGNDCSTCFPKPRPIPCGVDLYEGRAIDPDPVGSVCVVSKGEILLILVNPLKTRGPSLLSEPRPGTSNNVRKTIALCHAGVNPLLVLLASMFRGGHAGWAWSCVRDGWAPSGRENPEPALRAGWRTASRS